MTLLLRVILVVVVAAIVLGDRLRGRHRPGIRYRRHRPRAPPTGAGRGRPRRGAGPRARRDGVGAGRPVGGAAAADRLPGRGGADRHRHRQAGARLSDQHPAAGDRRRARRDLGAGHEAERRPGHAASDRSLQRPRASTACSWPSSPRAPPRSSPAATRSRPHDGVWVPLLDEIVHVNRSGAMADQTVQLNGHVWDLTGSIGQLWALAETAIYRITERTRVQPADRPQADTWAWACSRTTSPPTATRCGSRATRATPPPTPAA